MMNGNKCSSSIEIGSTKLPLDNCGNTIIKKETVGKIKSIGGHVGLLITLMLYTAVGGLVSLETKMALSRGWFKSVFFNNKNKNNKWVFKGVSVSWQRIFWKPGIHEAERSILKCLLCIKWVQEELIIAWLIHFSASRICHLFMFDW